MPNKFVGLLMIFLLTVLGSVSIDNCQQPNICKLSNDRLLHPLGNPIFSVLRVTHEPLLLLMIDSENYKAPIFIYRL